MIAWLRAARSANFYKKHKRLSKAFIVELFRDIRQNSDSPSNNLFHHIKEPVGGAAWSGISFFYEREPAFLDLPPAHSKERICGFVVLVEYRDHVALFKSNLDVPSDFKAEYFQRVGNDKIEAAIASADATFEQIQLRNMATSKYALRSKTLEADNLESVVGPSGASRFVPRGYRVRRGEAHYSATPSSGRISLRSDRANCEQLVHWAVLVIDMLNDGHAPASTFIRAFARSVSLDSISPNVLPTYMAVDVPRLTEALFESEPMQLLHYSGGNAVLLNQGQINAVLSALNTAFPVKRVKGELRIIQPDTNLQIGTLSIGKTRISLRRFAIPDIENLRIEPINRVAGEEKPGVPLKRYIDQNNLYTILFSDVAIAYLDGALYRDDSIADGQQFLSYIRTDPRLKAATSEKGMFSPSHDVFDGESIFRVIVDNIAARDELLICDDLGDEWADFIGLDGYSQPKTISFYHAKHGQLTLGASAMHIVVSQAIKNLGRIKLSSNEIASKLPKWERTYTNDHIETLINRVLRGAAKNISEQIRSALSSPDTIRRVFIVTSSLSRDQLEQSFAALGSGKAPSPHFVQLYWLLMSYFSACSEIGAFPYLVCQP